MVATPAKAVEIEGIVKRFEDTMALDNVTLDIDQYASFKARRAGTW